MININTDVALFADSNLYSYTTVVRDHNGKYWKFSQVVDKELQTQNSHKQLV